MYYLWKSCPSPVGIHIVDIVHTVSVLYLYHLVLAGASATVQSDCMYCAKCQHEHFKLDKMY